MQVSISIEAKEAIKASLALVLVYFIALQFSWMNPYWTGFAVAMMALPTAGQSIHKGMLRLWGTIPGCIAALLITWSLVGGVQWSIFNYGRLKSSVRLQDAALQQLLEDYRQTVLQAQGEVENNIVALSHWEAAGKFVRAVNPAT